LTDRKRGTANRPHTEVSKERGVLRTKNSSQKKRKKTEKGTYLVTLCRTKRHQGGKREERMTAQRREVALILSNQRNRKKRAKEPQEENATVKCKGCQISAVGSLVKGDEAKASRYQEEESHGQSKQKTKKRKKKECHGNRRKKD